MLSPDETDKFFWKKYAEAIKKVIGLNDGQKDMFFLAMEPENGPLIDNDIPEEYMNLSLYRTANTLLPTDNRCFKPSDTGYAEALQKFLYHVDLEANPDMGVKMVVEDAFRDEGRSQEAFDQELEKALTEWANALECGTCDRRTDFRLFVGTGGAPAFRIAQLELDAASARATEMRLLMNPQIAAPLNEDMLQLAKVLRKQDYVRSKWNMEFAYGKFPSPFELKRMEGEIEEIPKPTAIPVPWYAAPAYKSFVQAAEERLPSKFKPRALSSFTFNAQDGSEDTSINGISNSPFGIWLGFKTDSDSFPLYLEDEIDLIQVKVIYDKIETIPITRGEWEVDISRYNLRSDAPAYLKTRTRPSSLVVATGLGYEITLGPKTAEWLIYFVEKAMEGKGVVTVFGSPVDVRSNEERKKDAGEYLFKGDWDNATKTFKAIPTFDAGCATILGVVGEKINIRTAQNGLEFDVTALSSTF